MVCHNVELLLFLFQLKGCAHVNVTVFNEHCSVAGCATNHNFRFCVSCDFALTSFGVAHCIDVNDDILYFWAEDLRLDSSCICIYVGNILLLGWLYNGFCSGTDFQPIVVLYSAVGDLKEIPFLDQRNVV